MRSDPTIILIGASVRALAFSALHAGLRPWCVDLFADTDLKAVAPVRRLSLDDYPHGFLAALCDAPKTPIIVTGSLENHPDILDELVRQGFELWSNSGDVVRAVRNPVLLRNALIDAGIAVPAIGDPWERGDDPGGGGSCRAGDSPVSMDPMAAPHEPMVSPPFKGGAREGMNPRWLLKPRSSGGGLGVKAWLGEPFDSDRFYLQEFIPGIAHSAVYLGGGAMCQRIGVTRLLSGVDWLNAPGFAYCGNIGPIVLTETSRLAWDKIGDAIVRTFGLRGLFGVDAIVRPDGVPVPIEVNPRYTASVEVFERAFGVSLLARHVACFIGPSKPAESGLAAPVGRVVAKGILYARKSVRFPAKGDWSNASGASAVRAMFTDLPAPGEEMPVGQPVLTVFSEGSDVESAEAGLRERVRAIDRQLFP